MFTDPKQIARAAVELLDSAKIVPQTQSLLAAIELGAATTANHVWDWHERTGKPPHDKQAFKKIFPDWDVLRKISNGYKHPKSKTDISRSSLREIEWEDDDFWYSDHKRAVLFIEVDGRLRAVGSLVRSFSYEYIDKC
jgi:hypothetical protein